MSVCSSVSTLDLEESFERAPCIQDHVIENDISGKYLSNVAMVHDNSNGDHARQVLGNPNCAQDDDGRLQSLYMPSDSIERQLMVNVEIESLTWRIGSNLVADEIRSFAWSS